MLLAYPPGWVHGLQPLETDFDHPSELHGLWHTNRVMTNVLLVGFSEKLSEKIVLNAFCAAVIHDQARNHDGDCIFHGKWARNTKLPRWKGYFLRAGVREEDMEQIGDAVEYHSKEDLPVSHSSYQVMALLKDADALDRYRLGYGNLKPEFLRFPSSKKLMRMGRLLYDNHPVVEKCTSTFATVISHQDLLP